MAWAARRQRPALVLVRRRLLHASVASAVVVVAGMRAFSDVLGLAASLAQLATLLPA